MNKERIQEIKEQEGYKRSIDAIEDDLDVAESVYRGFFDVLTTAERILNKDEIYMHAVQIEEILGEMLGKFYRNLEDEIGYSIERPKSVYTRRWEYEQRVKKEIALENSRAGYSTETGDAMLSALNNDLVVVFGRESK